MEERAPDQAGRSEARYPAQSRQDSTMSGLGPERWGARKRPPIYLVFPPGLEGKRKRALLGLDGDESRED